MTVKEFAAEVGEVVGFVFNSTQPLTRTPSDLRAYYFGGKRVSPPTFTPVTQDQETSFEENCHFSVCLPESFDQEEVSCEVDDSIYTVEDRLWFNAPHLTPASSLV